MAAQGQWYDYGGPPSKQVATRQLGPMGVDDPNMIWDEARGGYWIRETVVESAGGGQSGYGGASYGHSHGVCGSCGGAGCSYCGGGKIIRTTHWDDHHDEPPVIIKKVKTKIIHEDSDGDEYNIYNPPPIVVMPPAPAPKHHHCHPAPETSIYLINMQPPAPAQQPAPQGPTGFFPVIKAQKIQFETQQKSSCVASGCCEARACGGAVIRVGGGGGGCSGGGGGCGGGGGGCGGRRTACQRCLAFHN